MVYLDARGAAALQEYQYSGSDASLLYRYFFSPLAQFLVDHCTPRCVAPNLITVSGLALVVASHAVHYYYLPDLSGVAPAWAYYFAAAALLVYAILDNMDGKQARKTGNASPMGLLFDHGCDAVNTVLSALTVSASVQFGAGWETLALVCVSTAAFYLATWEEYYTGTLALPMFNGANEGLAIIVAIHVASGCLGPAFWLEELAPGFRVHHVFLAAVALASLLTALGNVDKVLNAVESSRAFARGALPQLAGFAAVQALALAAGRGDVMERFPRMFPWALGLVACKMSMTVMVAHLTEAKLQVEGKTMLCVALGCGALLDAHVHELHASEAVQTMFVVVLAAYAHMVVGVISEMAEILKIRVFFVKEHSD